MGALIPIEPDHLCSLIALNAGERKPWRSFVGGMKWGIGHSIGMLGFCLIFLPLQKLLNLKLWEHYGNYVAGLLLVSIGIYFLANESKYLEVRDDGSWAARQDACCCHGPAAHDHAHGHGDGHGHAHDHDGCSDSQCAECEPLLPASAKEEKLSFQPWDCKGAVVGLLQGLCCPSCIAGMAFVGQMGAQHPSSADIVMFFVMCFLSIVICSALVSAALVVTGNYCSNTCGMSTRTLFWAACGFSIALGTAWVVLNACGQLRVLEYTSGLQNQLHKLAGQEDMSTMDMSPQH